MSTPVDHRRRRLFAAQTGLGVVGALALVVLVWAVAQAGDDGNTVVAGALVAVAVVILIGWALRSLERAKFEIGSTPVPDVDWARELREIRDSRRVIVAAFEIERRRIERDLHDGAQQHLVSAAMKLGEASLLLNQQPDAGPGGLSTLLEGAHRDAEEALRTLRATVSGIHPHVLSDMGLFAAVSDMAERSGVDVKVRCPHRLPEMPEEVAAVGWFFCSETLTNISKHAPGASATMLLAADRELHVSVMDDGPGGAHLRDGGGLAGMRERLAAFGGAMELASPPGGPTTVIARIPLLLAPVGETRS